MDLCREDSKGITFVQEEVHVCIVNSGEQLLSALLLNFSHYCFFHFSWTKDVTDSKDSKLIFSFGISVVFSCLFWNVDHVFPFLFYCRTIRKFIAVIAVWVLLVLILSLARVKRSLSCPDLRVLMTTIRLSGLLTTLDLQFWKLLGSIF